MSKGFGHAAWFIDPVILAAKEHALVPSQTAASQAFFKECPHRLRLLNHGLDIGQFAPRELLPHERRDRWPRAVLKQVLQL